MKRFVLAITALATLAVLAATPAWGQEEEPTSPLSIEITDPGDPAPGDFNFYDVDSEIVVTGTAAVGNIETGPDTSLVLVFDRSGSTGGDFNCGAANTIIACEREALKRVVAALPSGRVTTVTVISFAGTATNLGTFPASNVAGINAAIGTGNGGTGGGTNFGAALSTAFSAITGATAPADQSIVVFVSDGEDTQTESLPEPPADTTVKSFAIGGQGCDSEGFPSLRQVATDGDCTEVADLATLDVTILESIATELTAITVTAGDLTASVVSTPELPTSDDVAFTATFAANSLPLGPQTVCATASGEAGGDPVPSATDCVDITVVEATVDCAVAADLHDAGHRRRRGRRHGHRDRLHKDARGHCRARQWCRPGLHRTSVHHRVQRAVP